MLDSLTVKNLLNHDSSRILPEKYIFQEPVSPHLAAEMEGRSICIEDINLPNIDASRLVVEGAGGILVPINEKNTILSLVQRLKLPTVVVASSRLGTINHTCLTIEAIRRRNVPLLGVILNGPKNSHNKAAIEKYGDILVLDEIEYFKKLNFATLKARKPSDKLIEVINDFNTIRQ